MKIKSNDLQNELIKVNKPLKGITINLEPHEVILKMMYDEKNKKGKYAIATIIYKREKTDTLETIFEYIVPMVCKEYLETHWD